MTYTTINKSSAHFDTNLYQANGSGKTISNMDFQPDFVWTKNRDSASYIPALVDAVRGGTKKLFSNNTNAESTDTNAITAFNSDGYTFGSSGSFNSGTDDYVNWCWKANGAGSANTDGTITSTVSANTTAGFSIATWSGTGSNGSIGHGLGGVDCMIIKDLSNVRDFYFWQKTMAYNTRLELNNTEAFTTGTDNMTALPDATKINMAVSTQNNGSGNNYVGYFFQEKQGYSKFGSYTGNGNADGTFVYTGFKPAFVMIKNTTTAGTSWTMCDNKRAGYNASNYRLAPNLADVESTSNAWEMYSNGFKMTSTGSRVNTSGNNYIYMAFASEPLVGDNPATAR